MAWKGDARVSRLLSCIDTHKRLKNGHCLLGPYQQAVLDVNMLHLPPRVVFISAGF